MTASVVLATAAVADDFFAGKRISVIVGTSAGGGYDGYARLFAGHASRHIPGQPTIIVQNMPGASGIKAVNYLNETAPRDGTVIGTFNNAMPLYQILGSKGIRFNVEDFHFLGAMSKTNSVIVVLASTGVKTIEDAKRTEVIMGATGQSGTMAVYPNLLNHTLGTRFKVVTGYRGGASVNLAMERGEVQGRGSNSYASYVATNPDWIKNRTINILVQLGLEPDTSIPGKVPLLIDLAQNDEQRQIFRTVSANIAMERPFALPPGVPMDRVALLRKSFADAAKDPALIAEAKKRDWELSPSSGEAVQKIITDITRTPAPIVAKLRAVMGGEFGRCEDFSKAENCQRAKTKK
jgi:tripartite-type tricarboxylate transporter receptor subunit TctC